jgi:hypothetical protein
MPPVRKVNAVRRHGLKVVIAAMVLLLALVVFHGPLAGFLARKGLEAGARAAGIELEIGRIDIRLGRPVSVERLRLAGGPIGGWVAVGRAEIAPARIGDLMGGRLPWLARIGIHGIEADVQISAGSGGGEDGGDGGGGWISPDELRALIEQWWPGRLDVGVGRVRVVLDGGEVVAEGGVLRTGAGRRGELRFDGIAWSRPEGDIAVRDFGGGLVVRGEGIGLRDFTIAEEFLLEDFSIDLREPGVLGLACVAAFSGGRIEGATTMDFARGEPFLEGRVAARGIALGNILHLAGVPLEGFEGDLHDASVAFALDAADPVSGEAELSLEARALGLHEMQGVGATLRARYADRTLAIDEAIVDLRGNRISWSGRLDAAEGWEPASIAINGNGTIDLAALDALEEAGIPGAGGLRGAVAGDVTMRGTLEKPAAELRLEGTGLGWGGLEGGVLRAEASLDDSAVRVAEARLELGGNSIALEGAWFPREGHRYSAGVAISVTDPGAFSVLAGDTLPAASRVSLEWKGSGGEDTHEGEAVLSADIVESPDAVPLVMRVEAAHGPGFVALSDARIERGPVSLGFSARAGGEGTRFDGIALRVGAADVLAGHLALPWNPLVLLHGEPWSAGLISAQDLDVVLRGEDLDLSELVRAAGIEAPVGGTAGIDLSASGGIDSPVVTLSLVLDDLAAGEGVVVPAARFDFRGEEGTGRFNGNVTMPPMDPVTLVGSLPFGFGVRDGAFVWTDPLGALDAKVSLPETDPGIFQQFLPGMRTLRGIVSGEVVIGDSIASPRVDGVLRLRNGLVDAGGSVLRDLAATVRFDRSTFRLEETGGTIGAGVFKLSGGGDFSDPSDPSFDLGLEGRELLLVRNRDMRLRTNVRLGLRGNLSKATLAGEIGLVDGRIYQELEITPLLQPDPSAGGPAMLPDLAGLVTGPPAAWDLDITVRNDSPFLIVGDLAGGSIEPNITVRGTLGEPVLEGAVVARDVTAYLPFSTVSIPEARIAMNPANPRVPDVDLTGYSEVLDYDIRLVIRGPMGGSGFFLNSDPPLPQEAILLMLTTGLTPATAGAGSIGQAAIGQGGLLLMKAFARRFHLGPVDLDAMINRVGVSTYPAGLGGSAVITRGEFRLTDHFGVMAQEDSRGVAGAGMTWTWRFK